MSRSLTVARTIPCDFSATIQFSPVDSYQITLNHTQQVPGLQNRAIQASFSFVHESKQEFMTKSLGL